MADCGNVCVFSVSAVVADGICGVHRCVESVAGIAHDVLRNSRSEECMSHVAMFETTSGLLDSA